MVLHWAICCFLFKITFSTLCPAAGCMCENQTGSDIASHIAPKQVAPDILP